MRHHFEALQETGAHHVPLSPLSFLRRAESLHGARTAVIHGDIRRSWAETCVRIRAVAGGLATMGVGRGDTVSGLSPNIPELFELPMTGAVLCRHEDLQAAAVVAKPHEKRGKVPCAFVELRDGINATSQEIIAFCRAHLAGFKAPKAVIFATLPKTSTGKIQKLQLRNRAKNLE